MTPDDIAREASQALQQNPIDVLWNETTGGTADPVTGGISGGTVLTRRERIYGLVHFVPASTVQRTHAEIQTGDCIVDLPPATDLTGRAGLRFEINGRTYVPKAPSQALAQAWDAVVGGIPITRTLLLRPAA